MILKFCGKNYRKKAKTFIKNYFPYFFKGSEYVKYHVSYQRIKWLITQIHTNGLNNSFNAKCIEKIFKLLL